MLKSWDFIARVRRRQIESGADYTFTKVFLPMYRELVACMEPGSILEVGCGTGHLAKALSELQCDVTAIEPSAGMFGESRGVLRDFDVRLLQSRVEDLSEGAYDVVLSHLCVQAVEDLDGFIQACARRLAEAGAFIFSIPHPCFFNSYKKLIPSSQFVYSRASSHVVSFSITSEPSVRFDGVPFHHRPLEMYQRAILDAGLVLVDFTEVWPSEKIQALYGSPWEHPRYCVFLCEAR